MENNLEDIQRKSAVGVSNNITLRSEVINDNEKQANDDNPPLFWEKFFIREEFLKLYFQNLGINNNLKISRLTNIYDNFEDDSVKYPSNYKNKQRMHQS